MQASDATSRLICFLALCRIIVYFLLPDRFSDGNEAGRPLLDRSKLPGARPASFRFDGWSRSGVDRYQGGTIRGVISKLDYLKSLGIRSCLRITEPWEKSPTPGATTRDR